jgi:integrase
MAIRALNKLTTRQVETLGDGVHSDGGNLLLYVHSNGAGRSWVLRFTSPATGKVREMGLGRAGQNGVSLAGARDERDRLRTMLRDGLDPLDQRRRNREQQAGKRTFAEVAAMTLAKKLGGWKGGADGTSAAQWRRTFDIEAKALGPRPIDEITVADIKRTVAPMWDRGNHAAARMSLGRIETVFAYAIAHGWATNNPAAWSVFKHIMPDAPDVRPYPMIPWDEAPAILAKLRRSASMGALLLEFIILTAVRLSEARLAEFSEFDFDKAVWTIPAGRMKRGLPHAVPLSDRVLAIVAELRRLRPRATVVFPGLGGSPMCKAAIWATACRATDDRASVHGFRATFRSWCSDHAVPFEVAEACLAHAKTSVVAAYDRSTLLERRRPIMERWSRFLSGEDQSAEIVTLRPTGTDA